MICECKLIKLTMQSNSIMARKRAHSETTTAFSKRSVDSRLQRATSFNYHQKSNQPIFSILHAPRKVKTQSVNMLAYNKWFIKPSNRLKRSVPSINLDRTHQQFYYKGLFKSQYTDPENPFRILHNQKLKIFDRIPKTNIPVIDAFKRNQLAKRKRVPQIIEMLLKQHKEPNGK